MNLPKKSKKHLNFKNSIQNNIVTLKTTNGLYLASKIRSSSLPGYDIYDDFELTNIDKQETKWIFFSLNNGQYIIVNLYQGKVLTIHKRNYGGDITAVTLENYQGNSTQHWSFETIGENFSSYKIRNIDTGFLLTLPQGNPAVIDLTEQLFPSTKQLPDTNVTWKFVELNSFFVPQKPQLEELLPFPKLTSNNYTKNLPENTLDAKTKEGQLTAWTLLPAPLVQDGKLSLHDQLQDTSYYILEKRQYWQKLFQNVVRQNNTLNQQIKYEQHDTQTNTLTNSTGITITRDGGVSFSLAGIFGGTYSLKEEIKNNLKIAESQTTEIRTETTNTNDFSNNLEGDIYLAKYILMTELTLKRPISYGENNIIISQTIYNDPNTIQTTAYVDTGENSVYSKNNIFITGISVPIHLRDTKDTKPVCTNPFPS